jgi:hypothetical protein
MAQVVSLGTGGDRHVGSPGCTEALADGCIVAVEEAVRHVVHWMGACCSYPGEQRFGRQAAFLLLVLRR